ncbi:MAG: hypothetical protein ACO2ZP_08970 [Bacteriovoracaceae bacterium]
MVRIFLWVFSYGALDYNKNKRKKRRFKKRKLGPAYIQILFLLCLISFGHLKLSGVNNIDEFKDYIAKNKILSNVFGIYPKDELLEAEKKGMGVLQSLNELDQVKLEVSKLGNNFAVHFNSKNWFSMYDLIGNLDISRTDFAESFDLKQVNWNDAKLKEQINNKVTELGGIALKKVEVISKKEVLITFDYKKVMLKEGIPKYEEIPNVDKLDSHELEHKTGEIVLEKLNNKEVKIDVREIKLKALKTEDEWKILFNNELP